MRQRENYQRLKADYVKLRKSRIRNITGDPEVAKHTNELVVLLEHRLQREEEEREIECALLSTQLHEYEKNQCNKYILKWKEHVNR